MHNIDNARDSLEFLWNNYILLCEHADIDSLSVDDIESHIEYDPSLRHLRISTWCARQGFFMSSWALWEYYSRSLCGNLQKLTEKRKENESTVDWINRTLTNNSKPFISYDWFASANCLRNLFAHCSGHVACNRSEILMKRARIAFPDLDRWKDGYVNITHGHLVELKTKIRYFLKRTA